MRECQGGLLSAEGLQATTVKPLSRNVHRAITTV